MFAQQITRDELCLTVPAHRNYRVANHKPVPVTVYDYYNREQSARLFYEPYRAKTCDICEGDECGPSCNSVPDKEPIGSDGSTFNGKSSSTVTGVSIILSTLVLVNLVTLLRRSRNF